MAIIDQLRESLLFLVVLTGPLPWCLALVYYFERGRERRPLTHYLLVILTCWCFLQVCLGLLLSVCRILTPPAIILSETLLLSGGALLLFAAGRRAGASRPTLSQMLQPAKPLTLPETIVALTLLCTALGLLWRCATNPIAEYDSLAFHLPAMAQWLQTGRLSILDQFNPAALPGDPEMWENLMAGLVGRYPYSWELLCTLMMAPWREDFLVALPNVMVWGMLGVAIYLIAISLGASRIHSMAAATLAITAPAAVEGVNTMHIDLPFAAFFMISAYFGLAAYTCRNGFYAVLFLAALGMLAGLKMSAFAHGGLLAITAALAVGLTLVRQRRRGGSIAGAAKTVLLCSTVGVCMMFALSGYWYLRNLLELGNPLGLAGLTLAGVTIFDGPFTQEHIWRTTLAAVFDLSSAADWRILLGQIKLWLFIPFWILIFYFLLALIGLVKKRGPAGAWLAQTAPQLILLLLLAATTALYFTTPFTGDNGTWGGQVTPWIGQAFRYGLHSLGLLAVLAAIGATGARIRGEFSAALALVCCLIALQRVHALDAALIALIVAYAVWQSWRLALAGRITGRPARLLLIATLLLTVFVLGMSARQKRSLNRELVFRGLTGFVSEQLTADEPLGYLMSHRSFLFYGRRLDRKVLYTPARDDENREQWTARLRELGVDVLAVGPLTMAHWHSRKELPWLRDPDGPFRPIFQTDEPHPAARTVIYRLKN